MERRQERLKTTAALVDELAEFEGERESGSGSFEDDAARGRLLRNQAEVVMERETGGEEGRVARW